MAIKAIQGLHIPEIKMVTAMTEADVPGRVEFLIDAGHGWGGADRDLTIEATNKFFQRYLTLSEK